jgi:phosphoglycolate phosphatase-like HAD superfamily hydrolase
MSEVKAVLWDFDGTLADTIFRNFSINKEIFSLIKPELKKENWPSLFSSVQEYHRAEMQSKNWKELYMKYCGYTKEQTDLAGSLWSEFQLKEKSLVPIFGGIKKVLKSLNYIPHGICSQNCSNKIKKVLKDNNIDEYFETIIGYRDVEKQKPDPEGFITCVNQMKLSNFFGKIFYIGDYQEDVRFAKNAELLLNKNGFDCSILTIAVCYNGLDTQDWDLQPDYKAYSVDDITSIIS